MKKCINCNREYDDSKMFCPECGASLVSNESSVINANLNTERKTDPAPVSSVPWYQQWMGTIICIVGLLIEWEINAIVGTAVIVSGFLQANKTNSKDKIVSAILLGIGIILCFITIVA